MLCVCVCVLLHLLTGAAGPSWDDTANKPDGPVFSWVDRMLEQHQQKNAFFSTLSLASSAVESFLSANPQRDLLLGAVINRCYSSSVMIAKGYFNALVELFKGQDFTCPLHVLLALILFKVRSRPDVQHDRSLLRDVTHD